MITEEKIKKAEQCLIDNGVDADEADTVLQAIGYILLDKELYPEDERRESGPWYFTFGTDKGFPYQDTYVVVFAYGGKQEAIQKFRNRYPDRTPGTINCAFIYSWTEWQKIDSRLCDQEPADIIGAEDDQYLTWDEIYTLADGSACGSQALKRKDAARYAADCVAVDNGYGDPEMAEIPEEVIETVCNKEGLLFDLNGNLAEQGAF